MSAYRVGKILTMRADPRACIPVESAKVLQNPSSDCSRTMATGQGECMKTSQLLDEIRELNIAYLLLAQQMLREDRPAAMYRLGIGADVADLLESLTAAQISRMAASSTLLCRFRCDDRPILEMLSGYGKQRLLGSSHAAILIAGQPVATMS